MAESVGFCHFKWLEPIDLLSEFCYNPSYKSDKWGLTQKKVEIR